jgi:hypothetical protein
MMTNYYKAVPTTACIINCLASSCEYYHFGLLWCISIQNHFGDATDHTRERWAQKTKSLESTFQT